RRSRRDRGGATGTVAASRVFTHRTVAAARNRASGFGGDWRVRQQLPVGVGPDDRMPPGSRVAKVGGATGSRLTYCFTLIKPAIPLAVAYRDRRCRQRRGLKLPGQREPGVSPGKAP
ncbi:hypothetical protein QRY73_26785, partial [Escherichia coli]|uniref:hypothetical protein n=1 Tax=Escherichia coli TaxID=562 RepID=UPI00255BF0E1